MIQSSQSSPVHLRYDLPYSSHHSSPLSRPHQSRLPHKMSFFFQPRAVSNKENSNTPSFPPHIASSPIPNPTETSKPRVSGIGRAPKRNHSTHSTKPYASSRITSVQRAKLAVAKMGKVRHRPTPLNSLPKIDEGDVVGRKGRRIRQPDKVVHIPLQLPKPIIPPVGEVEGVVSILAKGQGDSG